MIVLGQNFGWDCGLSVQVYGIAVYRFYYVMMILANVTMYIALILTIVSLIDYLIKNKDVLKDVD